MIRIKRIYEAPERGDGARILVDRLWPRGVSKERAALDSWHKEIAPSPELRTWFDHDPVKFSEFSRRYIEELTRNPATEEFASYLAGYPTVTLLFAAKDLAVNHAVVLRNYLQDRVAGSRP